MATVRGRGRRGAESLPRARPGLVRRESRPGIPLDKKEKTREPSSSAMAEEPEPVSYVVQGDNDIQALATKGEDLDKLHAPHLPHDARRIPVRRKHLVQKHQPKEMKKAPSKPLTSGLFDGREKILPHHILGSLEEFKVEALTRGNTQLADLIEVSCQDVSAAAKKKDRGEKKEKVHLTPLAEHKALQNWSRNMAIRKKQEKYLGEILQRAQNELLMNSVDDYRQIQEERDLIAQTLPALQPGKGYQRGSEFCSQPKRIGDELTGLTMPRERGYLQPVTHTGKPRTVQMEMASKPLKKIPSRLTWDRNLFLQRRRQELKPILEEQGFYKPDLEGLEVIGKGHPSTSVSTEPFPCSSTLGEPETLSDPLQDYPDVVPEAVWGPSLNFCGQPARWIECTTSHRNEIGIATRLSFEALTGERAEKSLMVSNDGTTAIWYDWMRRPLRIPSRQSKRIRMPCFYFDIRSGVILPGETRKFSIIFKSERPGIFSESWEFRTHPLLLGGALLQVTFWGMAVYEDKLADIRKKLEAIKSIPKEEQREAALARLNKAALELRVEQRPAQSDHSALCYCICLQLWRETIDNMVSHSMRLRSLLGLPENNTYADDVPEETGEVKQPINRGEGDSITIRKEERSLGVQDEEGENRTTETTGKENEEYPSSRKLKDEKKLKSSTSLQEVKEGAQAVEAVTADRAEPPEGQVDPVLFRQYQEKLYIGVYGLLKSMVNRMVALFEDLED